MLACAEVFVLGVIGGGFVAAVAVAVLVGAGR